MCKSNLRLTFSSIVNGNSTCSNKFRMEGYTLFFSLEIKVHITQILEVVVYLFSINNRRKFTKRVKVHIQKVHMSIYSCNILKYRGKMYIVYNVGDKIFFSYYT